MKDELVYNIHIILVVFMCVALIVVTIVLFGGS